MTHRKYILSLVCISAVLSGCTIETPEEYGEICPPKDVRDKYQLNYIVDTKGNHLDPDSGEYAEAFKTNVCPSEHARCHRDINKNYYCMAECSSGLINCNGKCINPDNDKEFCGARGKCMEPSPSSDSYWGVACKESQVCKDGLCVDLSCDIDEHKHNGECEPDTLEHCGRHENDCTALKGWKSGKCHKGVCRADSCGEGFAIINSVCTALSEMPDPCRDKTSFCIGDTERMTCVNDKSVTEQCPEKCEDGLCVQSEVPSDRNECDVATFTEKCSDDGKAIVRCEDPDNDGTFTLENEKCMTGTSCSGARCVCKETMPRICLDAQTVGYCSAGAIAQEVCAADKVCYNGLCLEKKSACKTDAECTGLEKCVSGACVVKPQCRPGIDKPQCLEDGSVLRTCNDQGAFVTKECMFSQMCSAEEASCVPRDGAACPAGLKPSCHMINDQHYFEECVDGKIKFQECNPGDICAHAKNGTIGCMQKCNDPMEILCTINDEGPRLKAEFHNCQNVETSKTKDQKAFVKVLAECSDDIYSAFCVMNDKQDAYAIRINCQEYGTTCDSSTGFCKNMPSCSTPEADCRNKKNVSYMCFDNPVGTGFVKAERTCPTAGTCDVFKEYNAFPVSTCYEKNREGISTLGTCIENGAAVSRISGKYTYSQRCRYGCKQATSEYGRKYGYCDY